LACERFATMAGIRMQHIPYKGAGPAVTDLTGGRIQMFMNNAVPLIPFVKSGRIRAIAVSGRNRLRGLPEVPTFAQAGMPDYEARSWQGILAPAGTPKPVIEKLSREIAAILGAPEFGENLLSMGAEPLISTPEQFAALIKTDLAKYARIIKQANIKLE
jgi:tripartite-type tricarboxylate transporter receptor subunit TctC